MNTVSYGTEKSYIVQRQEHGLWVGAQRYLPGSAAFVAMGNILTSQRVFGFPLRVWDARRNLPVIWPADDYILVRARGPRRG